MELNIDTTQYSVEELRQLIVDKFNISREEVEAIKGKTNVVNMWNSLRAAKLDDVDVQENTQVEQEAPVEILNNLELEIIDDEEVEFNEPINRLSPEWSMYVLNQLAPDEKDNDVPKTDGLRRLVEKLIGPIVRLDNDVVQGPTEQNGMVAVVRTQVEILTESGAHIVYSASADCVKSECPHPYNKFVTAIAETRAEGRVYRKILGLKNTATSEEIIGANKEKEFDVNDTITNQQISFIDTMSNNSRGHNINIRDLFHLITKKSYSRITQYNIQDGADVISLLNSIQKKEANRPENISGYDPNWRNYF